jgi:hypothetical protein
MDWGKRRSYRLRQSTSRSVDMGVNTLGECDSAFPQLAVQGIEE